jgi:glucose-1-phosphate adenylyltransferase
MAMRAAENYHRFEDFGLTGQHAISSQRRRRSCSFITSRKLMAAPKILALILAGGEGSRLNPLTAEHAKPALPFVNGYRIVDFVLSNLVNSRISTVYLLAQYKPDSLIRHIDTAWAPWSAVRGDSIKVVLPRTAAGCHQFKGTADAVAQNFELIERHKPDLVAVFAADHIYRMDVRQMVDFHRERDAEVTVAAVRVPIDQASCFGVMVTQADGFIREFQEKPARPAPIPDHPAQAYASMGNYLFDPHVLIRLLEEAGRRGATDFGRDILPRLAQRARVFAYDFSGNYVPGVRDHEEPAYWRDVGTLEALAAARQDALGQPPRFNLWNPHWPIRGEGHSALLMKIRDWKRPLNATGLPADAMATGPLRPMSSDGLRDHPR